MSPVNLLSRRPREDAATAAAAMLAVVVVVSRCCAARIRADAHFSRSETARTIDPSRRAGRESDRGDTAQLISKPRAPVNT
ncbi:hypothetical protein MTO96_034329 [Rhipicephalus appendiculatus]